MDVSMLSSLSSARIDARFAEETAGNESTVFEWEVETDEYTAFLVVGESETKTYVCVLGNVLRILHATNNSWFILSAKAT